MVLDMVADMEVEKVSSKVVDMVADKKELKCSKTNSFGRSCLLLSVPDLRVF